MTYLALILYNIFEECFAAMRVLFEIIAIQLFLQVAAPLETLGNAAAELHIRKPTRLGKYWFLVLLLA